MNRTLIAGAGVGLALSVGALVVLDERPSAETGEQQAAKAVTARLGTSSRLYQESSSSTQQAIELVRDLFARREQGNEPTVEEWQAAEAAIDDLRAHQDSLQLQRIDRLVEVADASPEVIEAELQKI